MSEYHWEVATKARTEALLEARDWLKTEQPDLVHGFCHEFEIEEA